MKKLLVIAGLSTALTMGIAPMALAAPAPAAASPATSAAPADSSIAAWMKKVDVTFINETGRTLYLGGTKLEPGQSSRVTSSSDAIVKVFYKNNPNDANRNYIKVENYKIMTPDVTVTSNGSCSTREVWENSGRHLSAGDATIYAYRHADTGKEWDGYKVFDVRIQKAP